MTSLTIPTYPFLRSPSFTVALRSKRALATLTLPAFDTDLISAAPLSLALPNFVGVPPGAGEVISTAVPYITTLDASPGLAAALAPGRPVERVTLHVARILYGGLRPSCAF